MQSDPLRLDFTSRADPAALPEWMDQPCSYEEFRACLRDLARVNRVTFSYRPTRIWLERLIARLPRGSLTGARPLHVVDVGAGQGDMLRYLSKWASRRGLAVRLTGIDLNPYAARAAGERTGAVASIEWITGDAFSYASRPGSGSAAGARGAAATDPGIDVVISSLFTHHLADAEIVRFLGWMESVAKLGWFINDLHRSRRAHQLFRLLARIARWHPFVQHDGPVSIRRSFSTGDWQRYCNLAGVESPPVTIEQFWPSRLCVGHIK